ncbi:MAG: ACP S-malonyltransferase [Fimbriimonadaceae bacterium]|nr:ACP S-malonyltransferase [Fimbriimonadaceae bacterium]
MIALLFPGQGSQTAGMGADLAAQLPAVRELFDEADAVLGRPLSRLCWDGPDDALKPTEIAQPALYTVGYAAWLASRDRLGQPALLAGHSLGEYTALAVAGVFDFATGLRLVRRRGELMRDAAAATAGAMAAILKLSDEQVGALCEAADGVVVPANLNSPGQVVVSGEEAAVEAVIVAAKAAGGRGVRLPVSGPFHSPLMAPAAAALAAELAQVEFHDATVPVVQNVTATATTAAATLRANLAWQVTGSVRWTATVAALQAAGVTQAVELGPGNVLAGLVGRSAPGLAVRSVGDCAGVAALDEFLRGAR